MCHATSYRGIPWDLFFSSFRSYLYVVGANSYDLCAYCASTWQGNTLGDGTYLYVYCMSHSTCTLFVHNQIHTAIGKHMESDQQRASLLYEAKMYAFLIYAYSQILTVQGYVYS